MSTAAIASPPDIATIITSLGVFSLAVAAVVGGIYKGIKEVKKGGADTGQQIASAVLVETSTLTMLTEANRKLTLCLGEVLNVMKLIERHLDISGEESRDKLHAQRASTEEAHRLRVAVVDLHEFMRSQRR